MSDCTDRERSMKVRNDDSVLSWVVAIAVLIAIMAIVIGHKGYVDAANGKPRLLASTTAAAFREK
jgi:hypothetical protein